MSNDYQAYLIRFQRRANASHWRATLENAHANELFQFATERELLLFLLRRLSESGDLEGRDADSAANSIGGEGS